MNDYDYIKNKNIDLNTITCGSNKYVWWKCKTCGHEWKTKVANRAGTLKRSCPVCARKKSAKNTSLTAAKRNNLYLKHREIALEFDKEKNHGLSVHDLSCGSEIRVWWKCIWCGTSFPMVVKDRVYKGTGCPNCAKNSTSFPEQAILFYLSEKCNDIQSRYIIDNIELDIFIPSKNVGIEYDGYRWHRNKLDKDNDKDKKIKEKGISLIRIRDERLADTINADIIHVKDGSIPDLANAIYLIGKKLKLKIEKGINIYDDTSNILSMYRSNKKENSILYKYPLSKKIWNYEKNGSLKPQHVFSNAIMKVWWKCPICDHEWKTTPNHITRSLKKGEYGCPKCGRDRTSNYNKIKVKNIETGEIFNSLTEAASSVNGNKSTLCSHLNGKSKTSYGYHWEYVDKTTKRRKTIKLKIRNIDKNIIFENSKEAAKWCSGDNRVINRCCNGVTATAYGYHWEYYDK